MQEQTLRKQQEAFEQMQKEAMRQQQEQMRKMQEEMLKTQQQQQHQNAAKPVLETASPAAIASSSSTDGRKSASLMLDDTATLLQANASVSDRSENEGWSGFRVSCCLISI